MPDAADPVAAYLAEVREHAASYRVLQQTGHPLLAANARLLAALEAVLALVDEWTPGPDALNLAGVRAEKRCAEATRAAISAALLGEGCDGA